MTDQQIGLLLLIKSALTGKVEVVPADFDLHEAFDTAKKHGITALLYYGARTIGEDATSETMQRAFSSVCKCILADERQRAEITRLLKAFDERGIKYMPLKGVNMKGLYPNPEMRMMGDADILITPEQYDEVIRPLMLELGYEEGAESDHELIWNKPSLHVELHKRLIPSYNKDYYEYFGDGWTLAKVKNENTERYSMTKEDEFVYLFTHFAKHYRDSGIGIRHMVDLWVYESHNPDMDKEYILGELKKLQLDRFYINIEKTLDTWFGDSKADKLTDFITNFIFTSGQYGKRQVGVISSALKESKSDLNAGEIKRRRLIRSVFPSISILEPDYPILKRAPFLLPFIWVIHFFRRVFTKNKLKNYVRNIKEIDDGKISDYQQQLNYVGLDFNFK